MDLRYLQGTGKPSALGSDLGDTDTRGPTLRQSLAGVTEKFYIDLPKGKPQCQQFLWRFSTTS